MFFKNVKARKVVTMELIWILQFRKESSNESLPKHHKLFESVVLRIERKEVNPSTSVVVRNVVVEDDIGKLSLETSVISSNQPNRRGWRQFHQTDWWAVNSCWRFSDQHFLTSSAAVCRSKKHKIIILEIKVQIKVTQRCLPYLFFIFFCI